MSTTDYSQLSTDDLIQHFVDEANRIGSIFAPNHLKVPFRSAEYDRGVDALHAIAAELCLRRPVAQARVRLFANESADVRGWAGGQLHAVDAEWAEAALAGLRHNLTTQEVLAWRHRLLQRRPRKLAVQRMTVEQLVERFVDGCERCYGATRFLNDEEGGGISMKAYNRSFDEVREASRELERRSKLDALLPLLKHPLITIRQHAASCCVRIAPGRAVPVLEEVAATKTWPEFAFAATTLDYWGKGQPK